MKIFPSEPPRGFYARLDPRTPVATALALALLTVLLNSWTALGAVAALAVLLARSARPNRQILTRRLRELNLLTVSLLILVPVSMPGTALWRVGALSWSRDGVQFALRIGVKANVVMVVSTALLGSLPPSVLAHALYRLGLPAKLAHASFFCVRYLEVLHREYHKLRNAMKTRAFRATMDAHGLRSLGYFVGMLFVRGVDRSDRILNAMKCRGYSGRLYSLADFRAGARDAVFASAVGVAVALVIYLEWAPWPPCSN